MHVKVIELVWVGLIDGVCVDYFDGFVDFEEYFVWLCDVGV